MNSCTPPCGIAVILASFAGHASILPVGATSGHSIYRCWKTLRLGNEPIELQVGQPYKMEKPRSPQGPTAIRLTSRDDPRSGIRLSHVIRVFEGITRVGCEATMKNLDATGRKRASLILDPATSPQTPVRLAAREPTPPGARAVALVLHDRAGRPLGELARAPLAARGRGTR